MFVGNHDAQNIFQKYIDKVKSKDPAAPHFLLLQGVRHLGKASLSKSFLQGILGNYYHSDFLHVRDLSLELEKSHSIKIALPDDKKKHFLDLPGGQTYHDIGTREITQWLQQAPAGHFKVVLIENIERMTISAANAFLKTAEEPLSGRLIVATTSNVSALLDTLVSRAVLVKFMPLVYEDLMLLSNQQSLFPDQQDLQELVVRMVMGKPGLLVRYAQMFAEDTALAKEFITLVGLLQSGEKIYQPHRLLLKLKEKWLLEGFVDAWIAYAMEHGYADSADQWLAVKKMMGSNVNLEHLMLYGLIKH